MSGACSSRASSAFFKKLQKLDKILISILENIKTKNLKNKIKSERGLKKLVKKI
jgi:hypothetical protein